MGRGTTLVLVVVLALVTAVSIHAARTPNDPGWREQWAQRLVGMPDLWELTTGSPDVVIATVDTGVDPTIPDIRDNLMPGWDFVAGDDRPRDTVGHGTHLASALVARGDNGTGMAGFCWQCRLMPVRVTATGRATGGIIAQGIRWAVDHGARIIVIGLNSPGPEDFDEHQAVRYAVSKGALVVASAGNTGLADLRYPASYPEVIAVAATNDFDQLYFWSTRGPWVELAAPGCQVILDAAVGPGTLCGTSFTPAAVAGVAALLWSLSPSLTAAQIREALVKTAKPVTGVGGGRIDPLAAAAALGISTRPTATPVSRPPGSTQSVGTPRYERIIELRRGTLRSIVRRAVVLGAGRLEVQLFTPRVAECSIAVFSPRGDVLVSLLPPADPSLASMTEEVRAGRHVVEVSCAPARKRPYTLSVSALRPVVKRS